MHIPTGKQSKVSMRLVLIAKTINCMFKHGHRGISLLPQNKRLPVNKIVINLSSGIFSLGDNSQNLYWFYQAGPNKVLFKFEAL